MRSGITAATMSAAAPSKTTNRDALIAWMTEAEVRPEAFARMLKVARSTVYSWRKGYPPSRRHAALLAKLTDGRVPADGWD